MIGFMAHSLAGHDKNKVYVIVKEDNEYVWLADGIFRKLENPKKKRKKHIQVIKRYKSDEIVNSFENKSVTNEMIKRMIKLYCKDIQEVK